MNRQVVSTAIGALLFTACSVVPAGAATAAGTQNAGKPSSCKPSKTVLRASAVPVSGLSAEQVDNATTIINAATQLHVPQRGQTIAVMTALEASALRNQTGGATGSGVGLFGDGASSLPLASRMSPVSSAHAFYRALTHVKNWENLPPTLAAHAAQRNLNPQAYARWWSTASRVVSKLTTGTGLAGLRNLAARAQIVADCEAATLRGRFALNTLTPYVGPIPPTVLDSRALDLAAHGGDGWFDRCQSFVAILDGRPHSGYSTALDAWQTFEAEGVAHPVTADNGVAPPAGAWLYYMDSTNPAGHVVTYLGNGQIASTDVFRLGHVGVGPASAITDGPWHMQYLGWAAPWGQG